MGMSDKDVTNNGNDGFTSVTFNTSSEWENKKSTSPFFKNTTITGSWDGVNYKGIIEMYGGHDRNHSLPIYGDTRFQYLTFNRNNNNENYDILYCQFYNLEMGEGIQMTNYKNMFSGDGTIKGAFSTSFQILVVSWMIIAFHHYQQKATSRRWMMLYHMDVKASR